MKAYSLWIRRCITLTMILVMVLALFNMVVDPNGVFDLVRVNGFNARKTSRLSDRITKFYYARRYKPDSIIMGNSRAVFIDPRDLENYTHGRAFNLALLGSGIQEQYMQFKYAITTLKVKNVVFALDFISFFEGSPNIKPIRAGTHFREARLRDSFFPGDYAESLFTLAALKSSYKTIRENMDPFDVVHDDRNGYKQWKMIDYKGDKDAAGRLKGLSNAYLRQFFELYTKAAEYPRVPEENIRYLRLIIDLAKEHNVQCRFYESPVYESLFDLPWAMGVGTIYEDWKRQIAGITDFIDFSGHNSITENYKWWGDASHTVTDVGAFMLARIYEDHAAGVPPDFGTLVTKDNIEEHLRNLRKQVKPVDLTKIRTGN